MENNFTLGISIGFLCGAIIGAVIGYVTNEIALWLAIGIGSGLIFGSAIGLTLLKNKICDSWDAGFRPCRTGRGFHPLNPLELAGYIL